MQFFSSFFSNFGHSIQILLFVFDLFAHDQFVVNFQEAVKPVDMQDQQRAKEDLREGDVGLHVLPAWNVD